MRQLLRNFVSGCLAAQFFVLALLLLDVGGIGQLIRGSDQPALPVAMLAFSLGLLGGAVSAGMVASGVARPGSERRARRAPSPAFVTIK